MKYLIITLFTITLLTGITSCGPNSKPPHDSTAVLDPNNPTGPIEPIRTNSTKYAVVIKIMDQVELGLSKVLLDDSTTILIYRGTESCAMLQLK